MKMVEGVRVWLFFLGGGGVLGWERAGVMVDFVGKGKEGEWVGGDRGFGRGRGRSGGAW